MLKELLLQFFLSLLPIFGFQLWYDKNRGWNGIRLPIVILCGVAMVICSLLSIKVFGYDLSFSLVPLLLGTMYGGYPALASLTTLYLLIQIFTFHDIKNLIDEAIFAAVFFTLIMATMQWFRKVSILFKFTIALSIIAVQSMIYFIQWNGYFIRERPEWNWALLIYFMLWMAMLMLATLYSISIIEKSKKKNRFYDRVKRMSYHQLNEVSKMKQLIEKASIAVLLVDQNSRITHVNEMAVKHLGILIEDSNIENLIGKDYTTVFSSEEEFTMGMLKKAIQGHEEMHVPVMKVGATLLYSSVSLRDVSGDHVIGASLTAQDITELNHLRDEVNRMERLSLVGQLAASITHEIRNPMAVIRGFVQLIQERSPQAQFEYFRIIMDELDRANSIISDFLSLVQNREIKMELTSLHNCINDLAPLLNADANMRGQTLIMDLCEELPQLMLNNREIKQMLLNIARNGMEAMEEKGVLRISTRYDEKYIYLRIADNGNGIPVEQRKNLFEPFFTTKTRGTGLGLPLCLSIAERHNGRIDVESEENVGTTFIVVFGLT